MYTLDLPLAGRPWRPLAGGVLLIAVLAALGLLLPRWLAFLCIMAAAHGIVALGLVLLMRAGVVSFGQGLVAATGGYTAAIAMQQLAVHDVLALALAGGVVAMLIVLPFAPLLARYRGIFFAMLTLAFSMVLYGILVKTTALGGSDGINLAQPTLFGMALTSNESVYGLYVVTMMLAGVLAVAARLYADSARGLTALAVRDNELRVEYLGGAVERCVALNLLLAAFCGGVGGALMAMALGHVDPYFSYWTASGEFVFLAILGGFQSVSAVFLASFLLEMVRSFSGAYFPNTWQLALGLFLLATIRFLPDGIGSLWAGRRMRVRTEEEAS